MRATRHMATALPTAHGAQPLLSITYGHRRRSKLFSTSGKHVICRPYHAARIECGLHASNEVAADRPWANACGAFSVFVGELEKSTRETNQLLKLE